jgi:hypothetical protein
MSSRWWALYIIESIQSGNVFEFPTNLFDSLRNVVQGSSFYEGVLETSYWHEDFISYVTIKPNKKSNSSPEYTLMAIRFNNIQPLVILHLKPNDMEVNGSVVMQEGNTDKTGEGWMVL